jgi:hypothetical protein
VNSATLVPLTEKPSLIHNAARRKPARLLMVEVVLASPASRCKIRPHLTNVENGAVSSPPVPGLGRGGNAGFEQRRATIVRDVSENGNHWITLVDPEGNEFDLISI